MVDIPRYTERTLPPIRSGHYEMVNLVPGSVQDICNDDLGIAGQVKQNASKLPGIFKGFQMGKSATVHEVTEAFERAHYVLDHNAIGETEQRVLRSHMNSDMRLANAFGMINRRYEDARKPGDPYGFGLIAADLLQVLDPDIAGAILRANLNPTVADDIAKGHGLVALGQQDRKPSIQVVPRITEGFLLLQPEKRAEILAEMSRMGGQTKEQARRLYQNISAGMNDRNSVYNAQYHIYRNLTGTMASEQLIGVRQDIPNWRDITK